MTVSNPSDALVLIKKYARMKQEHFGVICLTATRDVITTKCMYIGTRNRSYVSIRELLSYCLKKECDGLILFHNHPSGRTEPSSEDIETTNKIKSGCKSVGIDLLDHVIIGKNGYYSFLENDLVIHEKDATVKVAEED